MDMCEVEAVRVAIWVNFGSGYVRYVVAFLVPYSFSVSGSCFVVFRVLFLCFVLCYKEHNFNLKAIQPFGFLL